MARTNYTDDEMQARLAEAAPIPGCPNYFIHPDGSVLSTTGYGGVAVRDMRTRGSGGYPQVTLVSADKSHVHMNVHRLVAEAFLEKPPGKNVVRHLNGDPQDNRVENLAWGSVRENVLDTVRHGRAKVGESHWKSRLSNDDVRAIRALYKAGLTQYEIADRFAVTQSSVWRIVRGLGWRHVQ